MTVVIFLMGGILIFMLRESRKRDTREKIVRHAVQLFKEKGYDNVTVDEITQVCGIAKGTFFNYFPKKENVLLYLADSYAGLMNDIVNRHREGNVKDRLINIFRELLHIYSNHTSLLGLTLIETLKSAILSNEGSTNLSVFQDAIRNLLEEAQEDGRLHRRFDPRISASVLAAIFYHTLIHGSQTADEEKMIAVLQQQLDVVWEGIAGE